MTHLFQHLMETPDAIVEHTYDQAFALTPEQIRAFQRHWVVKRFTDLRPAVPFLRKLADEHGIASVSDVDDIVPLLFAHTVYKSYPLSYIEKNRFDRLTKWLGGLTTSDLGGVDAAGIESIDDWIDLLDAKTDLMVLHTSGTTGKLSFLPRTKAQQRTMGIMSYHILRDWNGPHSRADMQQQPRPVINPGYRWGAGTAQRSAALMVEMVARREDNALFLYPDQRLSADMLSLAGRLSVAESRGEQGALEVSPALLRRREELIQRERERPQAIARFLDAARERFAGQDVYIGGVYPMIYDWAVDGLKHGHRRVFGSGSFLSCGGGTKGRVFPDNWKETIQDFMGFTTFNETYAMTECMAMATRCAHGKFHLPPVVVPYLLDPQSGRLLPRKDGTTGRYAFFDLMPDSYWAGMVTGDRVTMSGWERPCDCGRAGCYVEPDISRYGAQEGGDDKVLCSGAPEAHDKALAFLTDPSRTH